MDARNAVFVRSPVVSAVGETRRTTRFIALAVLGASTAIAAAGCSLHDASPPSVTASARGTRTSSEQAILAAAIDAYTRYSAALDAVLAGGDGDYSDLAAVTSKRFLDTFTAAQDEFSSGEWKTTGSTSFDSEELVEFSSSTATVRLCRDVSRVRVISRDGTDVTPPDREERFSVLVDFIEADGTYVIDSSERLTEDASCAG